MSTSELCVRSTSYVRTGPESSSDALGLTRNARGTPSERLAMVGYGPRFVSWSAWKPTLRCQLERGALVVIEAANANVSTPPQLHRKGPEDDFGQLTLLRLLRSDLRRTCLRATGPATRADTAARCPGTR